MKKLFVCTSAMAATSATMACEVCEKRQPKLLRGILHGAGPESKWDYLIVAGAAVCVVACLYYTIRYLYKPGETNENHIKHTIL
jgi:hypothetical protein